MVFRFCALSFCAVYSTSSDMTHKLVSKTHHVQNQVIPLAESFDHSRPQFPYLLWKVLLSHTPFPLGKKLMRKISHGPWSQVGLSAAGGSQESWCDDRGYLWSGSQDEGVFRQTLPEVHQYRGNSLSSGRTARAIYSHIRVTPNVIPQGLSLRVTAWRLLSISALVPGLCFRLSGEQALGKPVAYGRGFLLLSTSATSENFRGSRAPRVQGALRRSLKTPTSVVGRFTVDVPLHSP